MRMQAMQELGHEVFAVPTTPPTHSTWISAFPSRVMRRLRHPLDEVGANRLMRAAAATEKFDLIWIDKGLGIRPQTLRAVRAAQPHAVVAGYSPDDMAGRHNQSAYFLKGLPLYDVYFTTKTYGVEELKALGVPRVFFSGNAFDPHVHHPRDITAEQRKQLGGPVGFIGDYEYERAAMMYGLAKNGIPIRIWGPNWEKNPLQHPNLRIEHRVLLGDDYGTAICAFDVNLGFLRRINRDKQTQRSIEIPACAAFMLAERTDEHLALFEEGVEAAFFGSDEELLDKTRFYLEHPDERERVAKAGLARCLSGKYSYHDRLAQCLVDIRDEMAL
ncbi:MAG TPA: glycosyltransferase [Tepidisphaeraceae bacterium]|nr:glycosyltransferase [Tepidisphaeraceae bacterium]